MDVSGVTWSGTCVVIKGRRNCILLKPVEGDLEVWGYGDFPRQGS